MCVGSPRFKSFCDGTYCYSWGAKEKSIGEVVLRSWPLAISLEKRIVRDSMKRAMAVVMFLLA